MRILINDLRAAMEARVDDLTDKPFRLGELVKAGSGYHGDPVRGAGGLEVRIEIPRMRPGGESPS